MGVVTEYACDDVKNRANGAEDQFCFAGYEKEKSDHEEYSRENKECHSGSHGRDGYEGGKECSDDGSDGVTCTESACNGSAFFDVGDGVLDKGRGYGSKKEQGEYEDNHAGYQGGPYEKAR